jgi:LacI family transcriptional regulator
VTASRALQLLHERGLIETVDRSGSYLKDPARALDLERFGLYLRVTPGIWRQAGLDVMRQAFRAAIATEKIELDTDLFPIDPELNRDAWRKAIRRAKRTGARGIFFLPSRLDEANADQDVRFLECCREEELPVVLIERSIRGGNGACNCDLVSADNVESGRLATRHLLDIGRRRIVLVLASPTSTHLDRAAGYLHALKAANVSVSEILELPVDLPGREAYGWTAERLQKFEADAVICYHDYTAVGLILELLRRGIRVPHDLAVVGFDDYPIGNMFSLGLTTISYPMEAIARQALRLLRERCNGWNGPSIKVLAPTSLIVRESTIEKTAAVEPGKTPNKLQRSK